ncbi:MAG TPA: ABC transporter transmembrane domain-containing protein, partial [Candidatus Binataceae bacterium]|nr:ABC transporter transmembrane domain-containing protein [Candidatus Binataceae bacterium]
MAATLQNPAVTALSDPRASQLYENERAPFTIREAWGLLRKNWRFITKHRRLLALKCALAFVSLTFFLLTPWPMKIIVDNVIDGLPLTGAPKFLLEPLVGDNRGALLLVVLTFLAIAVVLIGMVGRENSDRTSTETRSNGLDQAGFTANAANSGWSLWGGLFGYYESRVTLDLTQRMNQDLRTTVYSRFLSSPLALYGDQKIGDAVFRVMHDTASIGAVLYQGVLEPGLSAITFLMTLVVVFLEFGHSEPLIPELAAAILPLAFIACSIYGRLLRSQSQVMRERGSDVMAAFEERLAQVQLIKAFGQETRETGHIDRASWESYRATLKILAIAALLILTLLPIIIVTVEAGLYYLMNQVIERRITLGDVLLLST